MKLLDKLIGQQIARVRSEAGMSVKALADALRITEAQLVAYEAGQEKATAAHLTEIGFMFKVSFLELFPEQETIPQMSSARQTVRQDDAPSKDTKH